MTRDDFRLRMVLLSQEEQLMAEVMEAHAKDPDQIEDRLGELAQSSPDDLPQLSPSQRALAYRMMQLGTYQVMAKIAEAGSEDSGEEQTD